MRIAVVAPSAQPFVFGGAERFLWGLVGALNRETSHQADLLKIPVTETDLLSLAAGYARFSELDLSGYDLVISSKYPAWAIRHPRHVVYMMHKLRGLYDTYNPGLDKGRLSEGSEIQAVRTTMERLPTHPDSIVAIHEALQIASAGAVGSDPHLPFPSALAKDVVHRLDDCALSPAVIEKYAAISQTVRNRPAYFPQGVPVAIAYPPTELQGIKTGRYRYFFTASRLDPPKRIDLLIRAFAKVDTAIPFYIAGAGPQAEELQALAAGDPRVKFLGRISDEEMADWYSNALAVVFAPQQEDYGLITLEAMLSGKPVITTTDSGGVSELVEHNQTGWVVEPTELGLASAFHHFANDLPNASYLGTLARERASRITWQNVFAQVLPQDALAAHAKAQRPTPMIAVGAKPKIVVAVNYGVYPPRGGGQNRMYYLYRELAKSMDVVLVSFSDATDGFDGEIAPGLYERRMLMPPEYRLAEQQLREEIGFLQMGDCGVLELAPLMGDYRRALAAEAASADAVAVAQPYLWPLARDLSLRAPLIHDSQNCEYRLKRALYPQTAAANRVLSYLHKAEKDACARAVGTIACSAEDLQSLLEEYGTITGGGTLVANGVDCDEISFTPPDVRRATALDVIGSEAPIAYFMGSWHQPNVEAVEHIFVLARALPDVQFLIAGSVGMAFSNAEKLPNLRFLGVVDETTRKLMLQIATVALNPMESGSGTNLKMFDYLAAGVPVVSTPFGLRGINSEANDILPPVVLNNFASAIQGIISDPPTVATLQNIRTAVEQRFDWKVLAQHYRSELQKAGIGK